MPSAVAPDGWQWSELTSLARLESGHTPSRRHPEWWGGSIPWVALTDARANHGKTIGETLETINELGIANSSARLLPEGTVCLSRTASVGYVVVMGRPMATSQDFVDWVCSDRLDPSFLKYLLLAEGKDGLRRFSSGAVHQTIYFPEVKAFCICHPSVPEQKRIVAILDEAFNDISTARANAEKNLGNARAIFESHLESVFSQRGEGRVVRNMADICAITSVLVDPREGAYRDLVHVGAGNIESNTSALHDLKTAKEDGLISGKFLFDDSMVLYSKIRPYLVKVARPSFSGLCSADMYPLAPTTGLITRDFLFYLLLSRPFTDYAIQGSARAGMPKVNREHLFAYQVPLPSVEEQTALTEQLDSLREDTQRLESIYKRKLVALDTLKQSLLHHAFSGQL